MGAKKIKNAKAAIKASAAPRRKERVKSLTKWPCSLDNLAQELRGSGLRIVEVAPDGNCFFRALGDQLHSSGADHARLRREVIDHVQSHEDAFAAFVEDDEGFETYVDRMRKDGTWAGHIELQAASLLYGVNISVHQSGQPVWTIQNFEGKGGQEVRNIHLSYHDGDHYNSVRLADDYGDGPAEDIPADWHSRTAAVPAAREWGCEEEALVQRGTGCDDGGAVTAALKECAGNSDKAIELLIERMAAGAALGGDKPQQNGKVVPPAPPPETSGRSEASSKEPEAEPRLAEDGAVTAAQPDSKPGRKKPEQKRPPRSRLCPCGSKQKHKNCCGSAAAARARAAASSADAASAAAAMPTQLLI